MKKTIKLFGFIAFMTLVAFTMAACGGKSDLVGKWYASKKLADAGDSNGLVYEFSSNGDLSVAGIPFLSYKVSGNTITTMLLGFKTGTANFSISGSALTISKGDPSAGLINGTYYKGKSKSVSAKDKNATAKNDEDDEDSPLGFLSTIFGQGKNNKNIANDEDDEDIGGFLSTIFGQGKNNKGIANDEDDEDIGGFLSTIFGQGKNNKDAAISGNEKGDEVSGADGTATLQQRFFDFLFNSGGDKDAKESKTEVSDAEDTDGGGGFFDKIANFFSGSGDSKQSASAKTNTEEDFMTRTINNGKAIEITVYMGDATDVTIPSKIQGLPVTHIGELAFAFEELTSVIIPSSVTTIAKDAFYDNKLTSVTIPNSVTSIGSEAFSHNQLTKVTIGSKVKSIGYEAFAYNQLTNVSIPKSVTSIGNDVFANNAASISSGGSSSNSKQNEGGGFFDKIAGFFTGGGAASSGADSSLNGTWYNFDGSQEMTYNNGNFDEIFGGIPMSKGKYTTSGGKLSTTTTHIYGTYFGFDSKWYTKKELESAFKSSGKRSNEEIAATLENLFFLTVNYSVNGNILNIEDDRGVIQYTRSFGETTTKPNDGGGILDKITGGGADSSLNGTWVNNDEGETNELKLNNGNYDEIVDGIPLSKGTYTTTGSTLSFTITHLYGTYFYLDSKWYSKNELERALKSSEIRFEDIAALFEVGLRTAQYSGNILNLDYDGEVLQFTRSSGESTTQTNSGGSSGSANAESDFEISISLDRTSAQSAQIEKYVGTRMTVNIPAQIQGIPVKIIGKGVFINKRLTSVTIPNSVLLIGELAFAHNDLTSITIPNSVTNIWQNAFRNNELTSVTIGNSVAEIRSDAFRNNKLTSVTIPNSVTEIDSNAFRDNPLTSITIGANVSLGDYYSSFSRNFDDVYNDGGKRAGTYTSNDGGKTWTRR